jgi:hypothetical protein
MGGWYTIGLCLGIGLAVGVMLSGILGSTAMGAGAAAIVGTAGGAVFGLLVGGTPETVAGAVGGFLGAFAAAVVVRGALRRGATRMGLATYLGTVGVLVLLLALIPVVGYLLAVVVPLVAVRLRGRQAARYAGLRTLAK